VNEELLPEETEEEDPLVEEARAIMDEPPEKVPGSDGLPDEVRDAEIANDE